MKTAHFRLPSASQKRVCLSSLLFISWNLKENKTENCDEKCFADVDFYWIQILPRNISIVHFNNFINSPAVTEHDDRKWRVLRNDQNWKVELFKLYLANSKIWMGTDVEAESKLRMESRMDAIQESAPVTMMNLFVKMM